VPIWDTWGAMSEENVGIVRRTFEAFETGGFDAMLPFYPEDVVWHPAPEWVEDPVYHGHDGVRKMSATFTENFDDLALEPCDIREVQDRVLVLAEATGRTKETGVVLRQPYAMVYSDFREGKIGEVRFYFTWQAALEAVGLQE
jgi:ketosteroid isomerase-like protein